MFLRCSYFLRTLSLNVLINMVLIKKKCVIQFRQLFVESFKSVTDQPTDRVTYRVECMRLKCLIISRAHATVSHSVGLSVGWSRC